MKRWRKILLDLRNITVDQEKTLSTIWFFFFTSERFFYVTLTTTFLNVFSRMLFTNFFLCPSTAGGNEWSFGTRTLVTPPRLLLLRADIFIYIYKSVDTLHVKVKKSVGSFRVCSLTFRLDYIMYSRVTAAKRCIRFCAMSFSLFSWLALGNGFIGINPHGR